MGDLVGIPPELATTLAVIMEMGLDHPASVRIMAKLHAEYPGLLEYLEYLEKVAEGD